tara:strand:+ start:730 stop:1272 length:543 start_codon:yes stop_codon:yes gene_type:complete
MIHKFTFYFIDKLEKSLINKLEKNIHIIYRNYNKKHNLKEILEIKKICKLEKRKFFLANNIKLAKKLNLDGVYIPSFNKNLVPYLRAKKSFIILGSAHNLRELNQKKRQNVDFLFLSPIFKIKKRNYFLGTIKYNILSNYYSGKTIALGGINKQNYRNLKNINCYGFASISYIEENIING